MQMRPCLKVLSGGPLRSQLFTIYPLRTYPDRDFVNELLQDINFGVRIVLIMIVPLDFLKSSFRNR